MHRLVLRKSLVYSRIGPSTIVCGTVRGREIEEHFEIEEIMNRLETSLRPALNGER